MRYSLLRFALYRKVAPQNIMYDRRVVRGNTFAALVIPVSKLQKSIRLTDRSPLPSSFYPTDPNPTFSCLDMQPDPISAEKQRKQAAMRRNRLRKMKVSGFDDELFV